MRQVRVSRTSTIFLFVLYFLEVSPVVDVTMDARGFKNQKKIKSYLLRSFPSIRSRSSFSNFDSFEFIQLRMHVYIL